MSIRAAAAISAAIVSSATLARASDFELRVSDHLALDVDRLRHHIDREVVSPSIVRIRIEPVTPIGAHAEVALDHRLLQRDIDLTDVKRDERERIIALAIGELLRAPSSPEPQADLPVQTSEPAMDRRLDSNVAPDRRLGATFLMGGRAFPAVATYALEPRAYVSMPVKSSFEVAFGAMTMHAWQADVLGEVSLQAVTLNAAAHWTHRISRTLSVAFGPRVDGGVAFADAAPNAGSQAVPTKAVLWILTAEAGASLDLSQRWRAVVNLDAGSTMRGLELRADTRSSASFSGATAAAHLGIAFE